MSLRDSLAEGLSAMQGRGADPSTLYGMAPATAAPMAAPAALPAPQAPPDVASAYGLVAPQFAGVQAGGGPQPGAMPGASGDSVSTAPPPNAVSGIGQNTFGVHPNVSVHDIVNFLLPRVRSVESSGDYKSDRSKTHPGQTASGAYQYIDSTWKGYQGYKRAVDAPPEVQDQRAREDFLKSLNQHGGDLFKAVASHYYPKYAHDPSLWTQPIVDGKGNPIKNAPTVEQYVSSVLPKERLRAYLNNMNGGGVGTGGAQ